MQPIFWINICYCICSTIFLILLFFFSCEKTTYTCASYSLKLAPRKKKLVKKLNDYKLRLKHLKNKFKLFDNFNSKALKTMILSAVKNQNRSAKAKRWTENEKSLAIAVVKKSPKLYRYLRQLVPLPSTRTLQSILSKMPVWAFYVWAGCISWTQL